jgi:hypothetical protein
MMRTHSPSLPSFFTVAILAGFAALATGAQAQTTSVTYDLKDVWLRPDLSHPRAAARQMTGTFVWTYPVGSFDKGSGRFTSLFIPWWGARTTPALKVQFDLKAIEFTMVGNYHGLGLDVNLRMSPQLSPHLPSPLDTVNSKFGIEVGVSFKGHVIRGSIVPRCNKPENYGAGTAGSGKIVPTITSSGGDAKLGNRSFRIDCDRLLGGATCYVVIGTTKARFPLIGVTVLVDPTNWLLLPMQATGTSGMAGAGTLRIPAAIPNNSRLIGARFQFQTVALDRGATGGVAAATDGLSVGICR